MLSVEARPSIRQQLADTPRFLRTLIREIKEAETEDAKENIFRTIIISELETAIRGLYKKAPEIIFQDTRASFDAKDVNIIIPQVKKPVIEGKAKKQVIFELPMEAKKPRRVLKNGIVKREEEKGDDYLFQKGRTTSLGLLFKEQGKYSLLTAEEEKELGKKVFVAKLALRNIQAIFEMLSPEDNSRAEIVLKGRGKFLLDVLKSELRAMPETIKQKENKGKDNSSERVFFGGCAL